MPRPGTLDAGELTTLGASTIEYSVCTEDEGTIRWVDTSVLTSFLRVTPNPPSTLMRSDARVNTKIMMSKKPCAVTS